MTDPNDTAWALNGLFGRLDKLRQTSHNTWKSCCPAHDDRSPSFQIKREDNGRILFHCFAGCEIDEICDAAGLEKTDLSPDKGHYKPVRTPANIPTQDTYFIEVIKAQLKRGESVSPMNREKYKQAVLREASR